LVDKVVKACNLEETINQLFFNKKAPGY